MKYTAATLLFAAAAIGKARAQGPPPMGGPPPPPPAAATSYYDDCTSTGSTITITGTATETYCPHCTTGPPVPTLCTATTYTTVYSSWCPTGLQPVTYTCTETCDSGCPIVRPTGYVPQGFTTSVGVCNSCGPTPITATITCPITPTPTPPCTTYTTQYNSFCSTGTTPVVYTVTETCQGGCPTSRPSDYVPQGFTTTVSVCNSCGATPITATITQPTAPPAPPASTPVVTPLVPPVTRIPGNGTVPSQPGTPPSTGGVVMYTGTGAAPRMSSTGFGMVFVAGVVGTLAYVL